MEIIVHRINEIDRLKNIPKKFGVEIDIRAKGNDLILNHEPGEDGDSFYEFVEQYEHGTLVLNIKEAGIEQKVIDLVRQKQVASYFLLDVEMPFVYRAGQDGMSDLAIRYSEYEPISFAQHFSGTFDWVWIDTPSYLPLEEDVIQTLQNYKSCLVCPERWGRPEDIGAYIQQMKQLNYKPNAVMTALQYVTEWEKF